MSKRILYFICLLFYSFGSLPVTSQNKTIETTGDVILIALPVATLATTLIVDDTQGTWQFTKGLILTEAITFGLKIAVNKPRPDGSDENSFPSGHTSTTFQSASFIHMRYGFKYSIPAYILAGYTAFTRMNADKHDIWDCWAGIAIGVGSSLLFTTEYQQEHMELTFNSFEGNHLLGFNFKFD